MANVVKAVVAFVRAVPTILWVLIFAVSAGLGSVSAVAGLTFHSASYLIKAYSESIEELDGGTIEALKAWLAREGGVDWSAIMKGDHPHKDHPGYRISVAQWRRLVELGAVKPFAAHLDRFDLSSLETGYGYAVTRKGGFNHYLDADWIKLMNALGAKLRGAMERRHPREMANG